MGDPCETQKMISDRSYKIRKNSQNLGMFGDNFGGPGADLR